MLVLYWLVLLICGIVLLCSLPFLLWFEARRRFDGKRVLTCPETGANAEVELDSKQAAQSSLIGPLRIRVFNCSRWPEREACAQQCIPRAVAQNRPDAFEIDHFAVFVAALMSWAASGALRNSPLALAWMANAGYPMNELWVTAVNSVPKAFPDSRLGLHVPQVAGFLSMLAVAYILAWFMRHPEVSRLKDAVMRAVLLWLAIIGATLPASLFLAPLKIFTLNALITLIALLIQAVVIRLAPRCDGGLSGWTARAQGGLGACLSNNAVGVKKA